MAHYTYYCVTVQSERERVEKSTQKKSRRERGRMAEGKLPEFSGRTKEFAPWAIKFKAGLLLNGEDIYEIDTYATTGSAEAQRKKKRKLGAYIIRHIDDNSVSLFLHLAEDGVQLWKALCAHHQTTDRTRQLELRGLIGKLKMRGGSL